MCIFPQILLSHISKWQQRTSFSQCTLKGCFFHNGQAVWKYTQKCNLTVVYKDDMDQMVPRAIALPRRKMLPMTPTFPASATTGRHARCPRTFHVQPLRHRQSLYNERRAWLASQLVSPDVRLSPQHLQADRFPQGRTILC